MRNQCKHLFPIIIHKKEDEMNFSEIIKTEKDEGKEVKGYAGNK